MKKLLLSSLALVGLVSANAQCFDVGTGADGPLVVNGTVTLNSAQVYNYTTVTINAGGVLTVPAWNGSTGGTLIIKVQGTLTINAGGSINVTGLGYRGGNPGWGQDNGNVGCGTFSSGCCLRSGMEGEIIAPGFGWAGGYPSGNGSTGGGGGGSYGTLGTAGQDAIAPSFPCSGGKVTVTYGTPNLSTLYLGSGGGAGGACGWDNPGVNGGIGGNGGGIIRISATTLINNGSILCNGQNGGAAQPDIHGGSGGGSGGSGGSIYLAAVTLTNSSTISAIGGTGTPGTTGGNGTSGAGGNGGMGRIRFDYTTLNNTGSISPVVGFTGSVNGVTATQSHVNVTCNGGNNGTATVTPSGGTPPYTYMWMPGGQTTVTATGLTAITYTCTVTDANTCTTQQVVTITQPTAITATNSQTNVSCFGGNNGTATVTPTGGTPGYTYNWAPAGGTNATATGLSSGCYTCTITDANGCTLLVTVCPTQPTVISSTNSQNNVLCNGGNNGSATVVASGGTSPYTYMWMPSGGTNATATGLTATNYTCTITDANSCTSNQTFTITEPTALILTMSSTFTSCGTCCDGTATATVTGGTAPYIYVWSPTGGNMATATGLCPGSYTCCVTDANGCTACNGILVSFNVGIQQNVTTTETMNAFPNPFSETLTLDGLEKGATVKITNALGETVYTTVANTVTTVIDTRKFASGIYFVEVKTSRATETKKIVKE